jgi:hypothetical protein
MKPATFKEEGKRDIAGGGRLHRCGVEAASPPLLLLLLLLLLVGL